MPVDFRITTVFEGSWAVFSALVPDIKTVTIAIRITETKIREDRANSKFPLGERINF